VRQREAARRKRAAIIPLERLQRVEFRGKPAWKGPRNVAHTFANEAEEQVAIRLARTYAPPFPYHLLTAEIRDGQLILACKTLDYRFPIRLDMDVPPFLFAATIDHLREAELGHRRPRFHRPPPDGGHLGGRHCRLARLHWREFACYGSVCRGIDARHTRFRAARRTTVDKTLPLA
jgi:hypothetical protein